MSVAGHSATLKVSGTAVAVTAEATTNTTGNVYQVTASSKRRLDPTVAVVVYDGGTPVTPSSIDYLYGTFTLASPPGGAVTADFSYLPVATLAEGKSFTMSAKMDLGDVTVFESAGVKKKLALLKDCDFKLERLALLDDIDPDAAGVTVQTRFAAGTTFLLELGVGGANLLRAFVKVVSLDASASVDGVVTVSLSLTAAPVAAGAAWAFGT